jgi:hypothetical protein
VYRCGITAAYHVLILSLNFLFSFMDPSIRRCRLIVRGAAMVVVMSVWLFIRFRRMTSHRRGITYSPMSVKRPREGSKL